VLHSGRLERLSSLFRKSINYDRNKFYDTRPREQYNKTLGHNFKIS
jgi:hypothetical protein